MLAVVSVADVLGADVAAETAFKLFCVLGLLLQWLLWLLYQLL